jgi:hypothetical protein
MTIQEQKRYPMTLARIRAVANSPNGFETITPQGARELLEEIADTYPIDTNVLDRCIHQESRIENLESEASAATATLERVRALLTPWRSQVWTVDLEAALAGQPEAPTASADRHYYGEPPVYGKPEAPKGQEQMTQTERMLSKSWAAQMGLKSDLAAAKARIAEAEAKYQIARQQRNAANARADAAEGRYRQVVDVNRANEVSYRVELDDRRAENARLRADADGFEERIGKLSAYNDQISAAEANAALERDQAAARADSVEAHFEQCHEDCRREKARADAAELSVETWVATEREAIEAERDQLAARVKELEFLIALDRTDGTS